MFSLRLHHHWLLHHHHWLLLHHHDGLLDHHGGLRWLRSRLPSMHRSCTLELFWVRVPAAADPQISKRKTTHGEVSDHVENTRHAGIICETVGATIARLIMRNDAAARVMLAIHAQHCATFVVDGPLCAIALDILWVWLPHHHCIERTNRPAEGVQDACDQGGSLQRAIGEVSRLVCRDSTLRIAEKHEA